MTFGRLLAAGKSIINGRGSVAYRENKSVFLPKFESAKNPFAKVVPASLPAAVPANAPGPNPAKLTAAPALAARPKNPARPVNWTAGFNPLAAFRGTRPGNLARPVKAEQTELSLDTVRVVGNDLSDTEVEIVPLKSRPARAKGAAQSATDWSEMGTGVFGANLV